MAKEQKEVKKQTQAVAPAQTVPTPAMPNPFARKDSNINAGAVAIEESRAVAEAMGKLYVAKSFPRDEGKAYEKVMQSCSRIALADSSEYSYPKGTTTVKGASIRLAEELARAWGNIDYGIRELSQKEGESEMEAYCWDLETNTISSQKFTVKHERTASGYTKKLTDQRDIYENNANLGARRLRARILAILPPDLVEDAREACQKTLVGDVSKINERVAKMLNEFKKYDVTQKHIEKRLSKSIKEINSSELSDMISIYNSLKEGMSKAVDWFDTGEATQEPGTALGDLNQAIKNNNENIV
jgi:hypothetical protein